MGLFVCRAQSLAREVTVSSDLNYLLHGCITSGQYSLPLGTKDFFLIDRLGILHCLPDVNMNNGQSHEVIIICVSYHLSYE